DHVVAGEQADEHPEGRRRRALDEHPAEILKMFQEGFYRPALVLRLCLRVRGKTLFGLIDHGEKPSARLRPSGPGWIPPWSGNSGWPRWRGAASSGAARASHPWHYGSRSTPRSSPS